MNAREWIAAVDRHLQRPMRTYEQRYCARMFEPENTDDTARIVADLLRQNDATPAQSIFKES